MRLLRKWLLFAFILQLFITGCSNDEIAGNPDTITLFDTVDLSFQSHKTYNTLTPWFNPFTQIYLKLELTSPSGRKLLVPGFFDGNGTGGSQGRIFKVRLSPDEAGLWHWQVQSNLPELNDKNGVFTVAGTIDGTFSKGAISILERDPKRFAFKNQTPHFLLGKFLDIDQPLHLRFSHTLLSERWSDTQREELVEHQLSLGINKINIYLANKGDYNGIATTPWLGNSSYNVKSRFDLQWWHQYETWIERLRDEGVIAHLWFFADDSGFAQLTTSERELLVTYGMARLSGYVNTIFTLALEWQESFTVSEIRKTGLLAQDNNPWQRLISVHGTSVTSNIEESSIFFDEDWLDFIEIQTGFVEHHKINQLGTYFRELHNKPVLLEEFSFGNNNDEQRINTWSALLTAPAGIGTGSGLKAVSNFLALVDITAFAPVKDLVATGNAYAATSHDGQVIIYVYRKGPVLFSSGKISVSKARWFNPREGRYEKTAFKLNTEEPLLPPTNQDWVLLITP